jgi:hypothetical protein
MKPLGVNSRSLKKNPKETLQLYTPTSAQLRAHISQHQFNVIRWGRQAGKGTYATNKLFQRAWTKPIDRYRFYWYVGPTYRLATQMYERALWALPREAYTYKSDSDLIIELKTKALLYYKSSDNPGGLLGETLDGLVMDECREQEKKTWEHYLMPMLGTTDGWADFLSTPNGFDWFHDLDQNSLTDPAWGSYHAPSQSNPLWTPKMLDSAKKSMTADLYAQEILAEYRELGIGSVYSSFSSDRNISDKNPFAISGEPISKYLPILIAADFNLNPGSWVLGQNRGRSFYWFDEIVMPHSHTQMMSQELVDRLVLLECNNVIIIGDASGKSSQRAASGQSDYDIMKNALKLAGIKFSDKTPDANPAVKDRVNALNCSLLGADGSVNTTIHPSCKKLITDLRRVIWKEGSASLAIDKSNHELTHTSDAIGYPTNVLAPIKQIGQVGKMRIISRSF